MTPSTPYRDENLQHEIDLFNARYAQPTVTPDTAPEHDGGIPDDDPAWLDWQERYPGSNDEEGQAR